MERRDQDKANRFHQISTALVINAIRSIYYRIVRLANNRQCSLHLIKIYGRLKPVPHLIKIKMNNATLKLIQKV
jgi:hypothetical protein